MSRLLPLLLLITLPATGAGAQELLAEVPEAVQKLRRHAQRVWTDARPVVVRTRIERSEEADLTTLGVDMVFVTNRGVVDGALVARGDAMPELSVRKREGEILVPALNAWERDFNVLRKFDWTHLTGEWLDRCGFPRPEDLPPGTSLHMQLERMKRLPVLVMRYSEGDEVCHVDDRGTVVYLFEEEPY